MHACGHFYYMYTDVCDILSSAFEHTTSVRAACKNCAVYVTAVGLSIAVGLVAAAFLQSLASYYS